MRSQLYRLAEVAEHPKTTIQIISASDAHAGLLGGFIIADLDGKPSVTYLETSAEGLVASSFSGDNGGACVEVGTTAQAVAVRDSTHRDGPQLAFPADTWKAFAEQVKAGV